MATDKRMQSKDWDDMNTGEKMEALGCSSPEELVEAFSDTLDVFNQIEDLVKKNDPPVPEAKLRKMILELLDDGEGGTAA